MLLRWAREIIPKDTIWIEIELNFQRQRGYTGLRFGMADNLKLIIEQIMLNDSSVRTQETF